MVIEIIRKKNYCFDCLLLSFHSICLRTNLVDFPPISFSGGWGRVKLLPSQLWCQIYATFTVRRVMIRLEQYWNFLCNNSVYQMNFHSWKCSVHIIYLHGREHYIPWKREATVNVRNKFHPLTTWCKDYFETLKLMMNYWGCGLLHSPSSGYWRDYFRFQHRPTALNACILSVWPNWSCERARAIRIPLLVDWWWWCWWRLIT